MEIFTDCSVGLMNMSKLVKLDDSSMCSLSNQTAIKLLKYNLQHIKYHEMFTNIFNKRHKSPL